MNGERSNIFFMAYHYISVYLQGIGCYMFRIDDYDVIDATLHGSAARFINHSCEVS